MSHGSEFAGERGRSDGRSNPLSLRCAMACSAALFLVIGSVTAQTKPGDEGARSTRPNIIVFITDDHRHDQLGCAGHPFLKTPNMDRLAKEGTRFERCHVTTSICAASRASILTGLYERTHGYTFGTGTLKESCVEQSYPVRLRAAGYRTGYVGKLGVSLPKGARERAFDHFRGIVRTPYFKKQPDGTLRHTTDLCADEAIAFLHADDPRPFLLTVGFSAPHAEDGDKQNPFPPPPGVADLYRDVMMPAPRFASAEQFAQHPKFLAESMNRDRWYWRWDTEEKYQRNLRNYYRMLSGIDVSVGRVLDALKSSKLSDRTVILIIGDNGFYMGDRGFAGKWSHYEESLRVPLIIYDPRAPEAARAAVRKECVLNIDLAPTILDLASVAAEEEQGKTLVPMVYGKTPTTWRTSFFCEHLMKNPRIPKWEGVHGERFVYARYFEQEAPNEFLHDLVADPDQLKNFATDPAHAETLANFRKLTDDWRQRLLDARH